MKKIYLPLLMLCLSLSSIAQITFSANDEVPVYETPFRLGVNPGYNGPNWNDVTLANISAGNPALNVPGIGMKAWRVPLPESFLEFWGYDIRVPEFNHYASLGMGEHTVFLEGPSEEHRDPVEYCEGQPSQLFANMYEPIWDGGANGTPVNEDNHAAMYVYQTVNTYKDYVKFWEIMNEPDFDQSNSGWKPEGVEGNWYENVPEPCDYKLKTPVYHYIRFLRISYEVIKSVDPDAFVAVGGIGFESFLDIILRHTDNPDGGQVSSDYPLTGGAYFDVLSFHSYPHFNGSLRYWDNDIQGFAYNRFSDRAVDGIWEHKGRFENVLANYGYDGADYPEKHFIITETNLPKKPFEDFIGSEEAQRNFVMKMHLEAYSQGLRQMHLYDLADHQPYDDAVVWLQTTGLYKYLQESDPYDVDVTEGGIGLRTCTQLLWGFDLDEGQTAAMALPEGIKGFAFVNPMGEYIYALWAVTETDQSEDAWANYTFPDNFNYGSVLKYAWDFGETGNTSTMPAADIGLNGAPAFFIGSEIIIPPDNTNELAQIAALSLAPNPIETAAILSFELTEPMNLRIDIINANGQRVGQLGKQAYTEGEQKITLDMANLPAGVYVFKIYNEVGSVFLKGVK